jgi:uncharacterized RDD family membrane protein YckC
MVAALHTPAAAAGFPRRALAFVLDSGIQALAVQALHWGATFAFRPSFASGAAWHAYLLFAVSAPCLAYGTLLEGSGAGATLGKRWLGLRVVDIYGSRIGRGHALWRNAVKLVPWEVAHVALCFPAPVFVTGELPMPRLLFSTYLMLGLSLAATLMTLKKQSFHDLAAGTCVVRVGAPAA